MVTLAENETGGADIWYLLDRDDRIIGLDGTWNDVAMQGGGPKAVSERVMGTRIYDHVAGHFTKKFLREFLDRARCSGQLARQSYRCDTPLLKRLMEMRAEIEPGDLLRVSHCTVGASALPFAIPVRDVPRPQARHLRCSICNRLKARGEHDWREPEDAASAGETLLVVHTVCPDCRAGIGLRRRAAATPGSR